MWGLHILVERNTSWRPSTVFQRHFCGCKAVKIPTALCYWSDPLPGPRNKSGSGRGLALAGRRLHHFMLKNLVESSPFLEIFWEILPRVFGPLNTEGGRPTLMQPLREWVGILDVLSWGTASTPFPRDRTQGELSVQHRVQSPGQASTRNDASCGHGSSSISCNFYDYISCT